MSPLNPRCPNCDLPVEAYGLCAACRQDRELEQARLVSASSSGKGLRCND